MIGHRYLSSLFVSCVTLYLVACVGDEKGALSTPVVVDDARGDARSDGAQRLGRLTFGEERSGLFLGEPFLAYEVEGQAGDVVSLSLAAEGFDPVLFIYGPSLGGGSREVVAQNDDADYPRDLSSRIPELTLAQSGDYLIVFRDYQGRSDGEYRLATTCLSGSCAARPSRLREVVAELGPQCTRRSPGTICGISVQHLGTGELAHWNGDRPFVSASSAKFVWVAAALHSGAVVDVVEPLAIPIFESSDNYATGAVIDLLSSPDHVNTFYWDVVGMASSGFCSWNYGATREAASCPMILDDDNVLTPNDSVRFLAQLWSGELLGDEATEALLEWSTRSPRTGFSAWIPEQLPSSIRATVHHKSGSLPPDTVPGYSVSNDIGIVELPDGQAYAIALLMTDGREYYYRQIRMMSYASCVIYNALATDAEDPSAGCTPPPA
jgi:beta-lactamase class A